MTDRTAGDLGTKNATGFLAGKTRQGFERAVHGHHPAVPVQDKGAVGHLIKNMQKFNGLFKETLHDQIWSGMVHEISSTPTRETQPRHFLNETRWLEFVRCGNQPRFLSIPRDYPHSDTRRLNGISAVIVNDKNASGKYRPEPASNRDSTHGADASSEKS